MQYSLQSTIKLSISHSLAKFIVSRYSFNLISAITCPLLTLPDHSSGSIDYSPDVRAPYDFGTRATYHINCNESFERAQERGDDVRTCVGDGRSSSGEWNGTAPICSGVLFGV